MNTSSVALVATHTLSATPGDGLPYWLDFFTFRSANVVYVLTGCVLLGGAAGFLGCYAFLRKRSLIGDALAHAALPGVCVAFLLSGKDPLVILVGASLSCWLGALCVDWITRYTRCKEDSALGMVLSVFFGVGILLLTYIQQSGNAAQSGLDKFLFGQAASLIAKDVQLIAIVAVIIVAVALLAYKELKLLSFDPEFAAAIGLPRRALEVVLATLIVLAVVIGLQAVGVVLMAALLVTPAAAARMWTDRLGVMLMIAAATGAAGGALGAYVSYLGPQMPTGPWMVLAVSTMFLLSLLLAPRRGLLPRYLRQYRFRQRTREENVLRSLYRLGEADGSAAKSGYPASVLAQHRNVSVESLRRAVERLCRKDLIIEQEQGIYALSDDGHRRAARLTRLHRLWEVYLTEKLQLAPDHVHDDAEEIEHIITPELEDRLAAVLAEPTVDPHQREVPSAVRPEGAP